MSNIKRFIPRKSDHELTVHDSVMAIKLTERNILGALNWAGKFDGFKGELKIDIDKKGDASNHRIKVKTKKGWRIAKVGDYLVRHFAYVPNDGKPIESVYRFTVGKDNFLEEFEQVPGGYFGS